MARLLSHGHTNAGFDHAGKPRKERESRNEGQSGNEDESGGKSQSEETNVIPEGEYKGRGECFALFL